MAQYFEVHPHTPQQRLIRQAAEIVRQGGVIVYPTDSSYAFGCQLDRKDALHRIRTIRQLDEEHNFTLICHDLSQVSAFARINNEAFRLIKTLTPGPYTFLLEATREVPRRLQHPKRKTIGIRLPDNAVSRMLVAELGEPLFSSTLILPGETEGLADPEDIRERVGTRVELILAAGVIPFAETTIVDLTGEFPVIVRQGKGSIGFLRA
ncbi:MULTISPECIES: L-threonylcarbamoyladenylate synthase [Methylococcus]|jgi:tRNA threonylcarbamoyl adenosine modification protein (Sua5/YciO/YrdC/YwlC family)|uniref:RNA-binding protein YciO n=1 Tax=Methylococcus capsulatus TaxID=414 RepID=A0AA35XVL3_METCP|nr:L-threonylcarbamoyladenylate synthase [Methylococcus capsulatus]CAI8845764.1 putative RNA-binding protein YciO [Methylococcus capsulatus]